MFFTTSDFLCVTLAKSASLSQLLCLNFSLSQLYNIIFLQKGDLKCNKKINLLKDNERE